MARPSCPSWTTGTAQTYNKMSGRVLYVKGSGAARKRQPRCLVRRKVGSNGKSFLSHLVEAAGKRAEPDEVVLLLACPA